MLKVSLFMICVCSGPVSLAIDHADNADLLDTECLASHRSPQKLSKYVIRVGLLTHDIVRANLRGRSLGRFFDGQIGCVRSAPERDATLDDGFYGSPGKKKRIPR